MCRFIVCIVYIHRYTSFLTEAALTICLRPDHLESVKPIGKSDTAHMWLSLQTRPIIISFLCVNRITWTAR